MIGRILSLLVAGAYLVSAYFLCGSEAAFRFGLFMILPLACIWFSDALGSYLGGIHGHIVTNTTPGFMIACGGWILLTMPIIIACVLCWRD